MGVQAGGGRGVDIKFYADMAQLTADLNRMKGLVRGASADIAKSARAANDNLGGMAAGIGKAGGQSKLAAHHVQNLAFQFQDMAVGLYSGQKPLTVFLQQGSQIAGVMAQAGIGVGGLMRSIGGMAAGFARAHPILLAIGAAAGLVMGAFSLMADEINKTAKVQVTATDVMLGTFDVLRDGLINGVTSAFQAMGLNVGEVWETIKRFTRDAINFIIGASLAVPKLIADTYDKIPAAFGDAFYSAANLAITALNWLIQKAGAALNWFVDGFNSIFGTSMPRAALGGIDALENPFKGGMAALGSAGAKSLSESFGRDYLGAAASAVSGAAQDRARQRMADEAEKAGKAAGTKAGKAAGKAAAENFGLTFAEAFKEFADHFKQYEAIAGDNAKLREIIEGLEREAQLVGITGWERERLLLILQREAELRPVLEQLKQAELAGDQVIIAGLKEQIELINEKYRLQVENGNAQSAFEKDAEAAEKLNDRLRDTVDLLRQMGGLGNILADALSFLSGDLGSIDGPLGYLFRTEIKNKNGEMKKLGDVLKDALGELGETFKEALKGAGMGMAASTLVFGKQGTGGQIASAIGGAAGQALGTAIAGPIGGAIGSVLGGLVGGGIAKLISGSDRGAAIISGGKVSGTYGDTSKYKEEASQIAGGVLDTLQRIADQFGATLNGAAGGKVSIGIRDGNYVVDPLGRGYTKTSQYPELKSFGKDAEAAAQYAIKLMLERGAIAMREGSLKIIKAASDLETGLAQALQFEEIMSMLEGGSSQLVGQVKAVRAQFSQYIAVMKLAGAATEDLTRVQEMQAARIKEIIAAAGDSYRSTFYTDAESLAFAQQTIKSTLDPLGKGWIDTVQEYMAEVTVAQNAVNSATDETRDAALAYLDTLYGLSDEFGVIKSAQEAAAAAAEAAAQEAAQKAAEIARQQATLEIALLEAQGKSAEALAKKRQQELAAMDSSLRSLQQQVYKAQDIAAARDVLSQAYERESAALQQTRDQLKSTVDNLREFREGLFNVGSSAESYAAKLIRFNAVSDLAKAGNVGAMGDLPEAGRELIEAAKGRARSAEDVQRVIAMVARATDQAILAGENGITVADQQLATMKRQAELLGVIAPAVVTMEQAIQKLADLGVKLPGTTTPTNPTTPTPPKTNPPVIKVPTPRDRPDWGLGGGGGGRSIFDMFDGMRQSLDTLTSAQREQNSRSKRQEKAGAQRVIVVGNEVEEGA